MSGAYVVSDKTLAALVARLDAPMPIGIPREDAFLVDGAVTDGQTPDWSRLQPWTPNEGCETRPIQPNQATPEPAGRSTRTAQGEAAREAGEGQETTPEAKKKG